MENLDFTQILIFFSLYKLRFSSRRRSLCSSLPLPGNRIDLKERAQNSIQDTMYISIRIFDLNVSYFLFKQMFQRKFNDKT